MVYRFSYNLSDLFNYNIIKGDIKMSDYNLGIDMYVTIKGDINLYREIESFVEDKLGLWGFKDKEITLKGQYDTNDYGCVLVGNMPEDLTCEDSILKKLVFDYNADIGFEFFDFPKIFDRETNSKNENIYFSAEDIKFLGSLNADVYIHC